MLVSRLSMIKRPYGRFIHMLINHILYDNQQNVKYINKYTGVGVTSTTHAPVAPVRGNTLKDYSKRQPFFSITGTAT